MAQKMRDAANCALMTRPKSRMLQHTLPSGFIAPCLSSKTDKLPSGSEWLHEIKHDGFRVIAHKKDARECDARSRAVAGFSKELAFFRKSANGITYRMTARAACKKLCLGCATIIAAAGDRR